MDVTPNEPAPRDLTAPGDDLVLPFAIEGMDVRGRLARIGPVIYSHDSGEYR